MAQIVRRVTGEDGGYTLVGKPRRITRRFADGKAGRQAAAAFAETLTNTEVAYDVRTRINGRTVTKTFSRRRDADAWQHQIEHDRNRGLAVDPLHGRTTLADYAAEWLKERTDLRPTTQGKYHRLLRHIIPTLGRASVGELTTTAVRTWYMALRAQHEVTADDAYRLLRAVMNTAVADKLIVQNPCQVKGAGQVRSAERPTIRLEELAKAVDAVPEHWKLAILLAAWCQLRRGEVIALQRRDVDLARGIIRVERAWSPSFGQGQTLGPPKTEAGIRQLAVPHNLLPAIEDHLGRFVRPEPEAWLFGTRNGTALSPRNFNRVWEQGRQAAGRPDIHLHDLRHSGLTWAAASGASVAELMRRGGHANPRAALRYQHATEDRDRAIADALGNLAVEAATRRISPDDTQGH